MPSNETEVCEIASGRRTLNVRTAPSTSAALHELLSPGEFLEVVDRQVGDDNYVWYALDTGGWIRSDIVEEFGECET